MIFFLKILLSYLACNKPSPPLVTSKKKLTQKLKHLLLYVAKKIYIKKFKSAKIKSYLRFSIAIIPPKFKKTCQLSYIHASSRQPKNYRRMFKRNVPSIFSQQPNLAKQFCGSLPFWLHHKIVSKLVDRVGTKIVKRKIGTSCWVLANYNSLACLSWGPQDNS